MTAVWTLQELARQAGGRISGNPDVEIRGVRPFESARTGDITLAAGEPLLQRIAETPAAAVIVPEDFSTPEKSLLLAQNPKLAFARVMQVFHPQRAPVAGISPDACVGSDCVLGDQVEIGPGAVLGDRVTLGDRVIVDPGAVVGDRCRLGADSILHANVTVYADTEIGERVIIHSGTVIGADGFGYVSDGTRQVKLPQTGRVVIEDFVEIGANSCVDRATFGETRIEEGVKLDNHVHVGHNCRIGAHTVIVGQVGVSGSVRIGRHCVFAGHSGVSDHVVVGDGVRVLMKSAVSRNVESGRTVSGQPAMDHREQLRIQAIARRLPEIYQLFRKLRRND